MTWNNHPTTFTVIEKVIIGLCIIASYLASQFCNSEERYPEDIENEARSKYDVWQE